MIRDLRRISTLLITALFLASALARAEEPDDQYLRICDTVQDADTLKANGQADAAVKKYQQAQKDLLAFRKKYPNWNTKVVNYRLGAISEKITEASPQPPQATNSTPPSETQDTKAASNSAAGSASSGQVKLLDAGAEPKKALRFHPKVGDKQTMNITVKMAVAMKMGQMDAQPMKMPAINITEDATVKDIAANGDITFDANIKDVSCSDDPNANPMVAQAMKSVVGSMKGITIIGTISDRGLNKNSEVKMPAGMDQKTKQYVDQMSDSFAKISFPLPEEAVGAGARWEHKSVNKSQGISIDQTATYKLGSVEGDRISMSSAIAQSAANQKVQSPGMPGVNMDLSKMTGKGTGSCTADLGQVLPLEATMVFHTDSAMGMSMGGQKQAMTMSMDLDTRISSK